MQNRSGFNALAYAAIPAALAIGALYWLAFGKGLHYFGRELSQEQRAASWVGAMVAPKEPVKIEALNAPDAVVRIDRLQFDGGDLWIYYSASGEATFIRYFWKQYAPDGTVVTAGDGYPSIQGEGQSPDDLRAGEKAELHLKIKTDPRTVRMTVWMGR